MNNKNLKIKSKLGDRFKKVVVKLSFPFRNSFMLLEFSQKAKKNQVNIDYVNCVDNLGDSISPVIVDYMLEKKNIESDKKVSTTKHLYAIGSVITSGIQDCTIWGSGILRATLLYRIKNRKFDIRAVRGPITRAILMDYGYNVPEVYGDPAILLPELYNPSNIKKEKKYGLVFHFADEKDKIKYLKNVTDGIKSNIKLIDIATTDYRKYIDEIKSVDIIISQSLHGIIIAESYGIPAILLKPNRGILKYSDWYFSTGRTDYPIASSVEEALNITPIALPNLNEMQKKLKEAFPYDIYE